jgi:hypothetical protein
MTKINQSISMTADVTIFEAPTNLTKIEISSTSGTVTLRQKIGGSYSNCPTTIPNGTFLVAYDIAQGTEIMVTGGNANIHYWA